MCAVLGCLDFPIGFQQTPRSRCLYSLEWTIASEVLIPILDGNELFSFFFVTIALTSFSANFCRLSWSWQLFEPNRLRMVRHLDLVNVISASGRNEFDRIWTNKWQCVTLGLRHFGGAPPGPVSCVCVGQFMSIVFYYSARAVSWRHYKWIIGVIYNWI